jgi:hypothetical protein
VLSTTIRNPILALKLREMYRQKYFFADTSGFGQKRRRLARRPPFIDGISPI